MVHERDLEEEVLRSEANWNTVNNNTQNKKKFMDWIMPGKGDRDKINTFPAQ